MAYEEKMTRKSETSYLGDGRVREVRGEARAEEMGRRETRHERRRWGGGGRGMSVEV